MFISTSAFPIYLIMNVYLVPDFL